MDFESISITQIIFNKIKILLDNDINNYLISKEEDLSNNKKINLYYILLKYILKQQIFIYQINFFIKTRKFIIKLINPKINYFENSNINNIIKERLEYIIEIITGSKYYVKKYKDLNEYYSSNITYSHTKIIKPNSTANIVSLENEEERDEEKVRNILHISQRYFFIKFISIIGEHKNKKNQKIKIKENTADFIIETSKFFISGGTNKELIFYTKDSSFEAKIKIKFDDWVYNTLEGKDIKESYMIITQRKQIDFLKDIIDKNGFIIYLKKNKNLLKINSLFSFKIDEDFIICCQNKVVKYSSYLIHKNLNNREIILLDKYNAKSAIKINDFVLFKSNKICSMGNDHLFILDIKNNKIVTNNIKDEYSFTYSQNGLTILTINIKNKKNMKIRNKTILLCACKKYIKTQKNGILLLIGFEEKIKNFDITTYFFETGTFEVYCFCPILIFDTYNILKKNITNTNYFLAAGFEKKKYKGIIKLFKVIYSNEKFDKIEFIQDIEIIDRKSVV